MSSLLGCALGLSAQQENHLCVLPPGQCSDPGVPAATVSTGSPVTADSCPASLFGVSVVGLSTAHPGILSSKRRLPVLGWSRNQTLCCNLWTLYCLNWSFPQALYVPLVTCIALNKRSKSYQCSLGSFCCASQQWGVLLNPSAHWSSVNSPLMAENLSEHQISLGEPEETTLNSARGCCGHYLQ